MKFVHPFKYYMYHRSLYNKIHFISLYRGDTVITYKRVKKLRDEPLYINQRCSSYSLEIQNDIKNSLTFVQIDKFGGNFSFNEICIVVRIGQSEACFLPRE